MKRFIRTLGLTFVAAFAFSAMAVASASAAEFTASETGDLAGKALENQVFTTNGGTVTCKTATTTGEIKATADSEQHVTVNYSNCTAFGIADVHISPATYTFTSSGQVHIGNTITIEVTIPLLPDCTVTVAPQTVGTVDFSNNGNNVVVTPTVTGISYTTSGNILCGSSGNNGTYGGKNEVNRVGGGWVAFDA